jgi:hypothetical protein
MFVLKFDQIKKFLRSKKPRPQDPEPLREAKRLGPSVLIDATNNLFRRRNDNLIVEHQKTLETLISTLTAYEAADPRDTIYAVLSIAKDTWRGHHLALHSPRTSDSIGTTGFLVKTPNGVGANDHDRPITTPQNSDLFSPTAPSALQRSSTGWINSDMQQYHNISADYDQDLLQVCKEFIQSSIKRPNSLDILYRHWAPVPTQMDLTPQEFRLGLTKEQTNWVAYRKLA